MASREPQIVTEPLGGSALSRAAQNGGAPREWYPPRPASAEEWRARIADVRGAASDWWSRLSDACTPSGAARERITSVIEGNGVVVTTGQQPGLFGGPVYTWSKALSALALADELTAATGVPTAPVFWAATDDADYAEASWTMVALPGGAERLELPRNPAEGARMADVPVPDCSELLETFRRAAGSFADGRPLEAVARAYRPPATVGSAYVMLLRAVLEPLGITVLDAAHASISHAAHGVLARALERAPLVDQSLRARVASIREQGFEPQVPAVDGLSLVFHADGGAKQRVALDRATAIATAAKAGKLSPNVLLRPVIERSLMPTVAYMAGPGELAYFAQVSAVAEALDLPQPLAVPRWSATVLEPHVAELLERYGLSVADFASPHAVETRLARGAWPEATLEAAAALRRALESLSKELKHAIESDGRIVPPTSVDALRATIEWRLERFSRRVTAGVKRRETGMMRDLGTIRGSLFPGGSRQERALNLLPLLARYGTPLLAQMGEKAREYARSVVAGELAAPAVT